jgi:site-specific DNA recombinase
VITGLDHLDRLGMRDIIRTVVRRIEINDSRIEVVFRVPSPGDPPGSVSSTKMTGSWQHCTSVGGTHDRLVEPVPPAGQGLGESQSQRSRFPQTCFHTPHVTEAMQSLIKSPDGL